MLVEFHTSRLHIRPVGMQDKEALFRYRSEPDTQKYLTKVYTSVEDIAELISQTSPEIDVPGTWFQFVLLHKETGELIGDVGLHFQDSDTQPNQVEIGYTLDARYRGKGFATEALETLMEYLFTTLHKHRITASIDPENTASVRLVERLGFRKEAHFVQSLFLHGRWMDDLVYALLASEWKKGV